MAIYYITGIKKETIGTHTFISHVLIHLVENRVLNVGTIMGKNAIITIIHGNNEVYSAIWNYANVYWSGQERVSTETIQGREYLRTTRDNSQKDNLLHLLPLANLGL